MGQRERNEIERVPPWPEIMTYPPLGPADYLGLIHRFSKGAKLLSQFVGTPEQSIHSFFREFSEQGLFPRGFHPIRTTDHYKAAVLYTLCRVQRPQTVIETGVASGISSTGILAALHRNGSGRLLSVDLPGAIYRTDGGARWTDISSPAGPGWVIPAALRDRWSLRIGPSKEVLPTLLQEVGGIDLFYHDSEHTYANTLFELHAAWSALNKAGIVAVDNINWSGAFENFSRSPDRITTLLYPFLGLVRRMSPDERGSQSPQ